ncbi:MAG TPA: aliphatic sulfonate ABC transporter substrate-binding protein [Oceanobacillus sp.]|nr:aliphatic sulfonate ABC transporter substrate-binding protein [Oceanobacillus sp.]
MRTRIFALLTLILIFVVVGVQAQSSEEPPAEIRIGYQRTGVWPLLKARGILEEAFPDVNITWSVFPAGQQLLEALNAGAIDIGITGDTPPIFAQAAGAPLVYVAVISGSGAGNAILVPEDSPLQTVADLEGKTVAIQQASSSHLLTVRALEQAGISYNDIVPAFLPPSEARAAFESGSVDAWTIWDPFREAAIQELNAQVLVEGQDVSPSNSFIEATSDFVTNYPETLRTIIELVREWQAWIYDNPEEYAEVLAAETGLEVSVILGTLRNEVQHYRWMDDEAIESQQEVADIFYNLGLIPEPLDISEVVWIGGENSPVEKAEATATPDA